MTKENYSDKEPDSFYGSQVKRVSQKNWGIKQRGGMSSNKLLPSCPVHVR